MKTNIERIIAAILLVALALTGSIVNTFAVAEEAETINETIAETVVEEEVFEEEIAAACVDGIVGEADMCLTEEGAAELTEETEVEVIEEAEEASLGELTGEAEEEAEPQIEDEDKQQLMADLIDMAVEETRDQGIYVALNATFATLADNAEILANPETGVIETDGNAIVNMTYDALSANFDENPEQLMGAIGAAALRANDAGYIQALGGDAVLSAMAAEEGDAEVDINMAKDLAKDYLELGIDTLADVHPAFKALSPLLKGLLGVAFDENEPDPMKEIQNKLDEIDHKLDEIEESVKSHTDNVVSLSNRGLAFDNIVANTKTLRTRMNNIWDPDSGYTQAEKIQQTADLYKTDYVKDLETALNGGTMAYEGTLKDFLDGQSVFEAAYRTACESVMFSSEAIDSTAPYLYQVLADYIAGYNLLDEVYDCYEAVYGANKLLASRDDMNARLAGIDRKGNKVCKSVMDLYVEYFKRDRYIFVGKSNNKNIKLNDTMVLVQNFAKECQINDNIMKTPDCMKNNPLSDKDVQLIADYCKEKRKSLFQYLLNEMKFDLKVVYNNKTYTASDIRKDLVLSTHCVVVPNFMGGGWAYNHGPINGTKYKELPQEIYLATGKQYITQNDKSKAYGMGVYTNTYWYYAQGIDTTGYCTGKDEKVQIMKRTEDSATLEKKNSAKDTDYYCTFMFFQGR